MRRGFLFGCLLGLFLAATAGCGKDSQPSGPPSPRPRLPKPAGVDKKTDPGKKS